MAKYNRILLKLSGEALSGEKGFGFDEPTVLMVGKQVRELIHKGVQVAIVIGGGNFWRGRSNESMDRTKADQIGMMATVMNSLYTAELFRTLGIKTVVQTPFKIGTMTEHFSKDIAVKHLNEGTVVFFAGGTGHPLFSTDTAAALRSIEIQADSILLAKNIDGVYDCDPKDNPKAKKYDAISLDSVVKSGLKVMDLTASILCLEHKVPMLVFALMEKNSIINAIDNKTNGTIVTV